MKLNDINKENGFNVPDNYFNELPDKILERINSQNKQAKKVSFYQKNTYRIGIAAGLLVLFGLAVLLNAKQQNQNNILVISTIDSLNANEELLAYEIDESYMLDYLSEEEETTNEYTEEYADDIINYLEYEKIDVENNK